MFWQLLPQNGEILQRNLSSSSPWRGALRGGASQARKWFFYLLCFGNLLFSILNAVFLPISNPSHLCFLGFEYGALDSFPSSNSY